MTVPSLSSKLGTGGLLLAVLAGGVPARPPIGAPPAPSSACLGGPPSVAEGSETGLGSRAQPGPTRQELPDPYKQLLFDNDFSYLDAPGYASLDPFDSLKRIALARRARLDIGGEYRLRFHQENGVRLDGRDATYGLQRARLYGDVWYDDWLRGYGELIDSTVSFDRLPPRTSEESRADVLNLFLDLRLWGEGRGGEIWTRVGRQELDLGSQRLLGAADWANDRNTFDGGKAFWRCENWDVQAFWTRPVPFARTGDGGSRNFRGADPTEQFMGVFAARPQATDRTTELYFLRLRRDRPVTRGDPPLVSFDANTFGGRWLARRGGWRWEFEGGYQFGRHSGQRQAAGFTTTGLGYQWDRLSWKPAAWLYLDWASGDGDPTDGHRGTFNQLFPQTHRYLGLSDIVGRQNIEDWNFLLTARPGNRLTLIAEGHVFRLAEARDSLYNTGGNAVRTDPTGRAGSDVGQEYDFSVRARLNLHADLLLTYGHFVAGSFLARTGKGGDADFVYAQFSFKF